MKKFIKSLVRFFSCESRAQVLDVLAYGEKTVVLNRFARLGILRTDFKVAVGYILVGQKVAEEKVRSLRYNPEGVYRAVRVAGWRREWLVRYFKDGKLQGYGIVHLKFVEFPPYNCNVDAVGYETLPVYRVIE